VRHGGVDGLAIHPERPLIALACWERVELWDWEAGVRVREFKGHARNVKGVAISRDGARLASGGNDSTIRIWDLADATEARTIFGHEGFVLAVAFGPDGTALASASEDHSVRLWETATGRPLASFLGHASHASALAFDPRGRWVASGGQAGEVKVWDLRRSRPVVYRIQVGWVTGVAFRGDGRRVASEIDPSRMGVAGGVVETKFWDPDTGEEDAPSAGMTSGPGSGYGSFGRLEELNAISPDGRWSARPGGPNEIQVTDAVTGRKYALVGHTNMVTCVVFSPDGSRIATTSWDRTIKLWDAATGRELLTLRGHTGGVVCVAFSPDGLRLASGSNDKTARVWDARPYESGRPPADSSEP
jgi:WD40 repeat protein